MIRGELSFRATRGDEVFEVDDLGTITAWLDASSGVARYEWVGDPSLIGDFSESTNAILLGDRLYEGDGSSTRFIRDGDPEPLDRAETCGGMLGKVFTWIGLACLTPWDTFEIRETEVDGATVILLTIDPGAEAEAAGQNAFLRGQLRR